MHTIRTITWLTFHEARRRKMVLAALLLGGLFLLVYSIGLYLINNELLESNSSAVQRSVTYNLLMIAGLYVVHFLTVMLAIFASVDTVSGEIASHTIQTIVTKPVRRWQVLFGKWLGYAGMLLFYLALLAGGILLIVRIVTGYVPQNPMSGVGLLMLESLVLLSLSLLGGTVFSTLTNGVALFMFYGLAFIGAWVEQIGSFLRSQSAVNVGIVSSLLMPVEALWRRAAFLMQPPLVSAIPSPFSGVSPPSIAMVVYALAYTALALVLAMRSFSQRDL